MLDGLRQGLVSSGTRMPRWRLARSSSRTRPARWRTGAKSRSRSARWPTNARWKPFAANPSDREAKIFYAIALDAAADPSDQTYAKLQKATGILETAFAAEPDHPGISHFLIHSYDVSALAAKGLPAARRYAAIAPDAPHALHMPSHIFTRVGACLRREARGLRWQDSITSNQASAAAAKKAGSPSEELHAMARPDRAGPRAACRAVARGKAAGSGTRGVREDHDA